MRKIIIAWKTGKYTDENGIERAMKSFRSGFFSANIYEEEGGLFKAVCEEQYFKTIHNDRWLSFEEAEKRVANSIEKEVAKVIEGLNFETQGEI